MNSPETIAVNALMAYLRLKLPAAVDAVNLTRKATMQTPTAGPWSILAGYQLKLTADSPSAAGTTVNLPTGASVTSTQIAAAINDGPTPGVTASVDTAERLVLTGAIAPVIGLESFIGILADTTGGNAALGFDPKGEWVMTSVIRAPGYRGIRDGYPVSVPDMSQGFWVILGDRDARPWPSAGADIRRGECDVHFVVELFKAEANLNAGKSREAITSVLRAVREVLQTDEGRYLGYASTADHSIIRVDIGVTRIAGRPFSFSHPNSPNVICDVAAMEVTVRVFQRTLGA